MFCAAAATHQKSLSVPPRSGQKLGSGPLFAPVSVVSMNSFRQTAASLRCAGELPHPIIVRVCARIAPPFSACVLFSKSQNALGTAALLSEAEIWLALCSGVSDVDEFVPANGGVSVMFKRVVLLRASLTSCVFAQTQSAIEITVGTDRRIRKHDSFPLDTLCPQETDIAQDRIPGITLE